MKYSLLSVEIWHEARSNALISINWLEMHLICFQMNKSRLKYMKTQTTKKKKTNFHFSLVAQWLSIVCIRYRSIVHLWIVLFTKHTYLRISEGNKKKLDKNHLLSSKQLHIYYILIRPEQIQHNNSNDGRRNRRKKLIANEIIILPNICHLTRRM